MEGVFYFSFKVTKRNGSVLDKMSMSRIKKGSCHVLGASEKGKARRSILGHSDHDQAVENTLGITSQHILPVNGVWRLLSGISTMINDLML